MRFSKETKIGLLIVITGAILYVGFNFLKGRDFFSSSNKYYVLYDNIEGLTLSNPVIINGYAVGRVSDITILHEKNDALLVKLDVSGDLVLRDGAKAKLASPDLLGGKVIELIQGSSEGEIKESGDYLKGVKEKGLAATLEEKATPVLNTLDTAISSLNRYFDDALSQSIRNSVYNTEASTKFIRKSTEEIYGVLGANTATIDTTVKNLNIASSQVNQLLTSTNVLIGEKMNRFVDSLNSLELNKIITSASNAANQLERVMSSIDGKEGSLGKMIHDPSMYNNLNTTLTDLDFLLVDFQANPQRYVNVSVFGGKVKDNSPIKKVKDKTFKEQIRVEFNKNYNPKNMEPVLYDMSNKVKHTLTAYEMDNGTLKLTQLEEIPSGDYILKLSWNEGKNSELVEVKKN
ncbi:MAG: MlaD family protein [Cyclobacteriaceae bacterium]